MSRSILKAISTANRIAWRYLFAHKDPLSKVLRAALYRTNAGLGEPVTFGQDL